VVPDGSSYQIIGGVFPVPTRREEKVLEMCAEADPRELCAFGGALARPPRIEFRPGMADSLFDRDAIQAALDELGPDGMTGGPVTYDTAALRHELGLD
jgi:hypothetical protein